jgi:plasmid stabilization system protein ParE
MAIFISNKISRLAPKYHNRVRSPLDQFPARCSLAPENEHFTQEIRQLLHGPRNDVYRILFTIQGDTVHVLHVRHGAQQHLTED